MAISGSIEEMIDRGAGMVWIPPKRPWLTAIKWIGTATGVAGALLIALDVGAVGWGFVLFAVSSALWALAGWVQREPSLVTLQVVFLAIDAVGVWSWLIA